MIAVADHDAFKLTAGLNLNRVIGGIIITQQPFVELLRGCLKTNVYLW